MNILELLSKEYRGVKFIKKVAEKIKNEFYKTDLDSLKIMNFCGTHEHTITYYGLRTLMPRGVELVAGPGCPVCITPVRDIDEVVKLALEGVMIYTYGDVFRVRGTKMSLQEARAEGGKVTVVYSFIDALKKAREREEEAVFFAIGFETTVPSVAPYIAMRRVPENLKIFSSYHLTPPAMRYVLELGEVPLRGVIAPGHVSTIIGAKPWEFVATEYFTPIVVAGFEPLDVMVAVYEIVRQNRLGNAKLINEYSRVVKWKGNKIAQKYIEDVFEKADGNWRGIGIIPESIYVFKDKYGEFDARREYSVELKDEIQEYLPGCRCGEITVGKITPPECPLFNKKCKPYSPYGPCMVSIEGTCHIWAKYGGFREITKYLD